MEIDSDFIEIEIVGEETEVINRYVAEVAVEAFGSPNVKKMASKLNFMDEHMLLFLPINYMGKYIESKMNDAPDPIFIMHYWEK